MNDTMSEGGSPDDLSALAWVHEELRRSLDGAHKALRRFIKDTETLGTSDIDAVDPAVLRGARAHLHQGVGALELVGQPAAAMVLRASESAVQRIVAKPHRLTPKMVDDIERSSFALLDYLGRLLAGKKVSTLSLFPQYRAVQEDAGVDRVHPADLWAGEWHWRDLPDDPTAVPRPHDAGAQTALESQLLPLMRSAQPQKAAARMSDLAAGLGAGATHPQVATLWKLAAAVFEAQAQGLLGFDVFSKRVASRLLAQFRILERGENDVSERLAQDLLFFCAQSASPGDGRHAPRLAAVRLAYELVRHAPADYSVSVLGRFDPAVIMQARKRVAAAKEAWSAVAGGELHRLTGLTEQFSLVGESLKRLFPLGETFATELLQSVVQTQASEAAPPAPLAMEVATSLLYIEAALEDGDFDHPEQAGRVERLAERLAAVREGRAPDPLEPWMEELYRRVSDRQTMGSVVQELRASLSDAEKLIDQYFRKPDDRAVLIPVPHQLAAMRGVLSVLGMDHAAAALLRMRDEVDGLSSTEVDPERVTQTGVFDRLAGNLGALGFLIDMLSVQPQMAKSLFTYDAEAGTLNPVMGRSESHAPGIGQVAAPPIEQRLIEQAQLLAFSSVRDDVSITEVARDLERLSQEAQAADQPALAAAMARAQHALVQAGPGGEAVARGELSEALVDFVATASEPVGLDPLPDETVPARHITLDFGMSTTSAALAQDEEMREIFLEEAAEVLGNANQARLELTAAPDDLGAMTTLRRAFHTLKGSSRMVGLKNFGEAAWACEQLYNTQLAEQGSAPVALLDFTGWSLGYLGAWVDDIRASRRGAHDADVVIEAARRVGAPAAPGSFAALADAAPRAAFAPAAPRAAPAAPATPAASAASAPAAASAPSAPLAPAMSAAPVTSALARPADGAGADDFDMRDTLPMDALDSSYTGFDKTQVPDTASDLASVSFELNLADLEAGQPPTRRALTSAHAPLDMSVSALQDPFDLTVPAELPHGDVIETTGESAIDIALEFEQLSAANAASSSPSAPSFAPSSSSSAEDLFERSFSRPLDFPTWPSPAQPFEAWAPTPSNVPAEAQALSAPSAPEAERRDAAPVAEAEEHVKVVGPLRIGIPLFNIYLNEADELSRRLTTEVAEWAMELHRPIGEAPIALAHSLAGSSATVGFTDLSQLARALEHAQTRSQAIGHGTPEEARLFVDATEEIRRLLHQFAAGFLKDASPVLMARLAEHEVSSARRLDAATAAAELDPLHDDADTAEAASELTPQSFTFDAPVHEPASQPASYPAEHNVPLDDSVAPPAIDVEPPRAEVVEPVPYQEPAAHEPTAAPYIDDRQADFQPDNRAESHYDVLGPVELKPLGEVPVETHRPASAVHGLVDADDAIDATDAIDAELFPIFAEEAEELLPQLASRLRDWAKKPNEPAHPAACMRTLHTLKGGARLAGAMRLGEMAHRLETRIEQLLLRSPIDTGDVETLQSHGDTLAQTFDVLRADGGAEVATPPAPKETPRTEPLPAAPDLDVLLMAAPPEASAAEAWAAPAPASETKPDSILAPEQTVTPAAEPVSAVKAGSDAPSAPAALAEIDWSRFPSGANAIPRQPAERTQGAQSAVRVRAPLLDRLVNQAGEVSITRSRIESGVGQIKASLADLTENLERLRAQLRDIEFHGEIQMTSRLEAAKAASQSFDPLEFDRFTRFQELTRMMAESVNDVATVQRSLQRSLETTEDELVAQARMTRDLQDDLLRTRMVEFEGLSDRLYRVVRQAAKETGKSVRLDIVGGGVEVDRGVLDRMTGAFEHLLRNCVTHGIEPADVRTAAGKEATGAIIVALSQEANEVSVEFRDDGAGLNLPRIREKGIALGLVDPHAQGSDGELANLIFAPGFSTADQVTELAGRGVGMDVVRSDVNAMGGRVETASAAGQGTSFKLILPLTTAVTQVVMLRCGDTQVAVPSTLVEVVRRATPAEADEAYGSGNYVTPERTLPFFWLGALLQLSVLPDDNTARTRTIVVIRSAQQRIALHVDDVLGNQEVVVKNLGQQLSRLPGLAGITLLASGAVALIYNPVALATLYGEAARAATIAAWRSPADKAALALVKSGSDGATPEAPLVLVVDDSLTVRRVTQRLLLREGYRVVLAKDGLDALERLAETVPKIVLSDIEMPRMDGFDLVRNMRADPRLRDLPVIMITSRIAQKHRDYAIELGVDHYLGKPYAEEDLLALIERYTRTRVAA